MLSCIRREKHKFDESSLNVNLFFSHKKDYRYLSFGYVENAAKDDIRAIKSQYFGEKVGEIGLIIYNVRTYRNVLLE